MKDVTIDASETGYREFSLILTWRESTERSILDLKSICIAISVILSLMNCSPRQQRAEHLALGFGMGLRPWGAGVGGDGASTKHLVEGCIPVACHTRPN
eukprot:COSAG02_NODE_919_length_15936_cov_5.055314_15_plen_99_part_00